MKGSTISKAMVEYRLMLIKASIIAVAVALVYMNDLEIVFRDALVFSSANITNYILVIPFLLAYIIYRKRKMLIAHAVSSRVKARVDYVIGLTLVFIALMLYIYGSLTLYAMEYHIYSIPIFVAGLTVLLFNLNVLRHAIFAVVILAYLQPPPAEMLSEIAGDLSWLSATLAEAMLKVYGISVALQVDYGAPALVVSKGDTQTPFFVGEPSSGLFSTIGLSLFALIAAYIARGAVWKRVVMYLIGFPLFFLLNALRISIILLLWYHYGEQVSESFHAISGSIMAVPGTLAILIIGERLLGVKISLKADPVGKGCEHCSTSRRLGEYICLACYNILSNVRMDRRSIVSFALIALIVSSMLVVNTTGVQAESVATRLASFDMSSIDGREKETVGIFLPTIDGYTLEYAYRDQRVEKVLRQDAALAYRYIKEDTSSSSNNGSEISRFTKPTIYVGVQISAGKHRWEDSMLIQPSRVGRPTAEVLELKGAQLDKESTARFFAYIRPNQKNAEAVLYWYERVPLRFGDTYENRNVQIVIWSYVNTLARNGFIKDANDMKEVEEFYLSLAKPIKSYWQQIGNELLAKKTLENTVRQGFPIVMGVAFLPASLLSIMELSKINSSKSSRRALYSRLTDDDRLVIDALINAENYKGKNGILHRILHDKIEYVTTEDVRDAYAKLTSRPISTEEVMMLLRNAIETELVKSMLVSVNDEPMLVWRSNVK